MSDQVLHVGRKSVMAYVSSGIGSTFWFAVWATATGAAMLFDQMLVAAGCGAVCLFVAAMGVYRLFYLASVKWIVTEKSVRVQAGILPWLTYDFNHPYATIFEAFYTFGFFAKLFGYGTVTVRRTEGSTTAESSSRMRAPAEITALINRKVEELRESGRAPTIVTTVGERKSAVDQLAELARLRASGDLTPEEFEIMKREVLGGGARDAHVPVVIPGQSETAPS